MGNETLIDMALHLLGLRYYPANTALKRRFRPSCRTLCPRNSIRPGTIISACPGARCWECRELLHNSTVKPGEALLPQTYFLDNRRMDRLRDDLRRDPGATWLFKPSGGHGSGWHGKSVFGTAPEIQALLDGRARPRGAVTKVLANPWLYRGHVTSARAYVAMLDAPLRVYAASYVSFLVALAPYDPQRVTECSIVTNLVNRRCRARPAGEILQWDPVDAGLIPLDQRPHAGRGNNYTAVTLPARLWRNMLAAVRRLVVRTLRRPGGGEPGVPAAGRPVRHPLRRRLLRARRLHRHGAGGQRPAHPVLRPRQQRPAHPPGALPEALAGGARPSRGLPR